jgi:simple sugar transport system substrate-binding protein
MSRFAPTMQLAAVTADWGAYYTKVARSSISGTWQPRPVWGGMKDGMVHLSAMSATVPAVVRHELAARTQALVAGNAGPFMGRLVDQTGRVRQERGALGDDAIAKMDWFVQGVVGDLPAR